MFTTKYYRLYIFLLILIVFHSCNPQQETTQEGTVGTENAVFLEEILGGSIVFDWAERSFSPMYSNIGLVFSKYPGFLGAYFHYNYKNRALTHLIEVLDTIISNESSIIGIKQVFSKGEMKYAFYDHNSILLEINEPIYTPHKTGKPDSLTWRGPTWMPMAWMMLEVLKKYEFEEEYWQAANRIYKLMLLDGELHELFNSQTGEGIGIPQLG
ncbi:MAG: hypothetical protein AAFO07_20605 [Bacteroidota bacterium]